MFFIPPTTKGLKFTSPTNNVNLYTSFGSPTYPGIFNVSIEAAIGSTNTATPAMQTTNSWINNTTLSIENKSTITGSTGSNGSNGTGGNGGRGGGDDHSNGNAGSAGGSGSSGGGGGIAFQSTINSTTRTVLFMNKGTITGGPGGLAGTGGGGGGGGGGAN